MATDSKPILPPDPMLPRPGTPGYEAALNKRLYDLLRAIAQILADHERRL